MALPLSYNLRNLRVRWRVTLLAGGGIALVVAVFAVLMAMSEGFAAALRATGRPDNAIVVQSGSSSEYVSAVPLADRSLIGVDDRIARGTDGRPLASWEWVVVMTLPRSNGKTANVSLRGITPGGIDVRGGIQLVEGRRFAAGLDEVIVGRKLASRVGTLQVGSTLRYQSRVLKVVGIFVSEGGAFESELWGDFDVFGGILKRGSGSNSLIVRMKDPAMIPALDHWIRSNPQMRLEAMQERKYYEAQAGPLATALKRVAQFVSVAMGIGAVFGAMNTMYALVAARTREIGTLRALGFSRRSILVSFVTESTFVAILGGVGGCLLACTLNGFSTGTGQTQSFSELVFAFRITPAILATALGFAGAMGVVGGVLPAVRGARLPIASALREH
jgi:putative ABC transport system permease protein